MFNYSYFEVDVTKEVTELNCHRQTREEVKENKDQRGARSIKLENPLLLEMITNQTTTTNNPFAIGCTMPHFSNSREGIFPSTTNTKPVGKVSPFKKSVNEVLSCPTISHKLEADKKLRVGPVPFDPEKRRDMQDKCATAQLNPIYNSIIPMIPRYYLESTYLFREYDIFHFKVN